MPDRCWDDQVLDAAVDAVQEGYRKAGLAVLRECRDYHETRTQRVRALGAAAVGQTAELRGMIARGLPQPDAADALLWLGAALMAEAARSQGEDPARSAATLREARDPLIAAAKLAPADATPWVELQRYARSTRLDAVQRDRAWLEATKRCPTSYPAHWARLQDLTEEWGGSHAEMFTFAREAVRTAPLGSPLTSLLPLAHAEFLLREGDRFLERGGTLAYIRFHTGYFRHHLRAELVAADDKWSARPRRRPYDKVAHNLFGWALLEAGEHRRARRHLVEVGNRPSAVPWDYGGDHAYARALVRVGLS
ncbi:hypothetical protein BJP25_27095 [Actinokineospora bangkokensis]|uniref:DUF4034 domain-containing protein n=1 Tax=Actinokineospora bangkokensis TaxID=1193682 RepID=A0A1Q9LH83_9PSEU|nr:hypothetical protein BJP25_27095 [Actinokineospora bangkokensis]